MTIEKEEQINSPLRTRKDHSFIVANYGLVWLSINSKLINNTNLQIWYDVNALDALYLTQYLIC